jgi:hypothetical protein
MFVIFGLVDVGFLMTIDTAPANGSLEVGPGSAALVSSAPPSWPWRRAALFLAGAAQLITISALVGADPIAATWSSLLLAVAPALLAAAAAFAPAPVNLLAGDCRGGRDWEPRRGRDRVLMKRAERCLASVV